MIQRLDFQLLLGRFLTRSGDQAWDFAVPIILLKILPDHLRIAALYYLILRLLTIVLLPRIAAQIDALPRPRVVRLGLGLQFVGVAGSAAAVYGVSRLTGASPDFADPSFLLSFIGLVLSGVVGSLGASLMDIAIANDVAPTVFSGVELSKFNSRFRQVDLFTEVASPVLAGLLLALPSDKASLLGFYLVVGWNLISFFPEYLILRSVFNKRPELRNKPIRVAATTTTSFLKKFTEGWTSFFKLPIAPVIFAYALLWLSALSPHGVLLTGFLQDGWQMPEWIIGMFRGSGAFFGLAATVIFRWVVARVGLHKAGFYFLSYQFVTVTLATAAFLIPSQFGQFAFLGMILASRIGLYGFSLGELQIRQENVPANVRGEINGFANSLFGVATLTLFTAGSLLPETPDFKYLVFLSAGSVFAALVVYWRWLKRAYLTASR